MMNSPGTHTLELVSELKAEHIRYAVFFMIGEKVAAEPAYRRRLSSRLAMPSRCTPGTTTR